jgi:hypothetical protein
MVKARRRLAAHTLEYGESRTFTTQQRGYYRLAQAVVLQAYRDLFSERAVVSLGALLWFMTGEAEGLLRLTGIEPPDGGALYAWLKSNRYRAYIHKMHDPAEVEDMGRSVCLGSELRSVLNEEHLDPEEFGVFMDLLEESIVGLIKVARCKVKMRRSQQVVPAPDTWMITEEDKGRILALKREGYSQREIAMITGWGKSTVERVQREAREVQNVGA